MVSTRRSIELSLNVYAHSCYLGDEESHANANRGDECLLRLLAGEHEDGEDELSGQELVIIAALVAMSKVFHVVLTISMKSP